VSQYRHLTIEDRYHIKAQRDAGKSSARIARKVGCHKSTINRELLRNKGKRGYRAKQAHRLARDRWEEAEKGFKMTPDLVGVIAGRLRQKWSPEQISGRLKREGKTHVSHERIYQYVLDEKGSGGDLWRCLRWSHRCRRKRYGRPDCRGKIPDRVSIEKRGRKANKRKRVGHLERDLVFGGTDHCPSRNAEGPGPGPGAVLLRKTRHEKPLALILLFHNPHGGDKTLHRGIRLSSRCPQLVCFRRGAHGILSIPRGSQSTLDQSPGCPPGADLFPSPRSQ